MTREEFIAVLKKKRYSYEMKGDKIVITHSGWIDLSSLKTIPSDVHFENSGDVHLSALKTLPPGVEFRNRWNVYLINLKTLPPGVEFENGWDIYLKGLGWMNDNKGIGIEGVENKRLLHLMIKKELFI